MKTGITLHFKLRYTVNNYYCQKSHF